MTPEERAVHLGLIFGLPDEVNAEELITNAINVAVAAEREALLDELLVGLAGMKICTPEKGFRNIGDALSHIRFGISDETARCAKVARDRAERIKHTSHKDGLGMGDQRSEKLCRDIAAAIERGGK